jgi:hypothetical protein
MLSKLRDPQYPIKNEGYNPELGLVTFGSKEDIEVKVHDPSQVNKAKERLRRDKIYIDAFFAALVGKSGITFSPRDMNSLIAEIVDKKPKNLVEVLKIGFLKHIEDINEFCKVINDPNLWGLLGKDGANINMPQFVWGDFRKIVHCIEVARDPDMSAERKSMVYELISSNQLDHLNVRSAADRHYVTCVPQIAADTRLLEPSSTGQCVQRYEGGMHANAADGTFWLKASGVKMHTVVENFSLHVAQAMGLATANPALVRVPQRSGAQTLAIRTDYQPDMAPVVSEATHQQGKEATKQAIRDFVARNADSVKAGALNVAHAILFKEMNFMGYNSGKLMRSNRGGSDADLIVVDRGSGMMYRGLGELKGIHLEEDFGTEVGPDLKFFVGDPDSDRFANLVFSGAVRQYLTDHPESRDAVIGHVEAALHRASAELEQTAQETDLDPAFKAYAVPAVQARIASLVAHLPEVFAPVEPKPTTGTAGPSADKHAS